MERYEYEQHYYNQGYDYIIGLDEAGRGPMAGELVVAGVVLPPGFYHPEIKDSKKLTKKKRDYLYDLIVKNSLFFNIEIVSVADVDRYNVYQASKLAMEKCLALLKQEKMFALTDAMPINYPYYEAIIKGDNKSISIGAASILAKVTRDRLMENYALIYPEYGFDKHKGYVTKLHKEKLEQYGPCPIHRKSFGPVAKMLTKQMSLDL